MANYLIYACEQRYGGLYGMYNYAVEYGITEQQADEIGHEMSIGVMESYTYIMEDLQEEAEYHADRDTIDDNEYEDLICEIIGELEEENAEWSLYRLRDDLTEEDKKQIKELDKKLDWEEIKKVYGVS